MEPFSSEDLVEAPWPGPGALAPVEGMPVPAMSGMAPAEAMSGMAPAEEQWPARPAAAASGAARNPKTLEQMMSLKHGDDERTEISKKVSWILRHGAKKVGVEMDAEGWVLLTDLAALNILRGVPVPKLFEVIMESNEQKARYEVKDGERGKAIRAVAKHTIGMVRDRRRREGPRGDPEEGFAEEGGHRHEEGRRPRPDRDRDAGREREAGPSFEEQVQVGFRPVYHGGRIVAMVREGETVRPGRRADGPNKGRGGRGKGEGGEGGKAFEGKGGRGKGSVPEHLLHQGAEEAPSNRRPRWQAQGGQEAIMRATKYVESEQVGTILPGSIVVQTGEEEVMQHGIVRMPVEYYNATADVIVRGWVTRTAEAANGPVFFRPAEGGGGGGKGLFNRGKGIPRGPMDGGKGKGRPYEEML